METVPRVVPISAGLEIHRAPLFLIGDDIEHHLIDRDGKPLAPPRPEPGSMHGRAVLPGRLDTRAAMVIDAMQSSHGGPAGSQVNSCPDRSGRLPGPLDSGVPGQQAGERPRK